MARSKTNLLRVIAEKELRACFRDLGAPALNDLATSLVRQWITNDGNAVVVTRAHNFWFRMVRQDGGGAEVARTVQEGTFAEHMRRCRVAEAEIPALLHELTLRQSARCSTEDGEPLLLRVDPAKRTFHIEMVRARDGSA